MNEFIDDKNEFDNDVNKFDSIVKDFIIKWYGNKCLDEYEESCITCKVWKNYEDLIENPFNE